MSPIKWFIDQTAFGYEISKRTKNTTFKEFFKNKFVTIVLEAKLINDTKATVNLKKDNSSLKFKYARIVNPIFRKEKSYNYFLISQNAYFNNNLFNCDIEITNKGESFDSLSKQLKKKISFKYTHNKQLTKLYSRKMNLGKFYPEADHFKTNKLILTSVNKNFIKDTYDVMISPNCSMFIYLYLQKLKNLYLVYDLTIGPGGEFEDEYDECFQTYSDDFTSSRYTKYYGWAKNEDKQFKLTIK